MLNNFDLKYKLKPLSDLFLVIGNILKPSIADTHEEPYSSHIPVLIGISSIINIKNILELGSGSYSTGLFLNKKAYPNLERLDSYEDDLQWGRKIANDFSKDQRLHLNIVNYPINQNLVNINYAQYDLIFIDDSQKSSDRAKTIKEICNNNLGNSILIIHDFEMDSYRKAAKKIKHYFTFSSYTPCTGVLWQKGLKNIQLFRVLDLINTYKNEYKTTDIEGWLTVFKNLMNE